jgi:hypothetical protein
MIDFFDPVQTGWIRTRGLGGFEDRAQLGYFFLNDDDCVPIPIPFLPQRVLGRIGTRAPLNMEIVASNQIRFAGVTHIDGFPNFYIATVLLFNLKEHS